MPVLTGSPSLVIASRVQVYHSCSVDLTWQRAVHSCQRCPRAALVRSAVTMPAVTQSNVERAHSRFCPAGVHMGTCVPASEVFAPSPKHPTPKSQTPSVGTDKTNVDVINSNGSDLIPAVWGPANLPVPAASPNHPVHAALARASYPPATGTQSCISTTSSVQHFISAQPVKLDVPKESNGHPTDPPEPLVNGAHVKQPLDALTEPLSSDKVVIPSVTIVREPHTHRKLENGTITPETEPKVPTENSVHTDADTELTTNKRHSETSADTRPSDAEKKSRTDDGTAKVRTSAASPIPMVDDGSSATAKSPTVPNENRRSTSRSSDRVISKQPAPTTYPDTEATRPDTTPAQNRTAASPRTQISSSGAGGVGDVNPALTRTQKPHTSPSHLPCPPKQQLTSPILSKPVPAFHFPLGTTRMTNEEIAFEMDRAKRELTLAVEQLSPSMDAKKSADPLIPYSGFGQIAKALNCSFYWKYLIYSASGGTADRNPIPLSAVLKTWHKVLTTCPDECARFVYMLTGGRSNYLVPSNFDPLIQDILESHPGLEFLREAEDFHSRYVATVVSRIFFNVNASWSGRISLAELRRSNFLSVLASLEDERDINLVTQYFSYEHFYVIYCKFWELDDDHDLIISRSDLARHNNYAISERMIDRIFSGTVTRGDAFKEGVMHYTDFVWFLLAEEDKRHPRSIEYWFRCMDLDGDGLLSMFELEYFYSEQLVRMEEMGIEPISFEDCLCQCLDMVKPELGDKIRLSDMKRCRLCHIFFDTFFNLPKYLQHEQRDPFSNLRDIEEGLNELSDWDRYAAEAYEMLITIENGNQEDAVDEDDPDEDDLDDAILATPTNRTTEAKQMQSANVGNNKLTEQKMLVESVGGGE